NVESDGSIVRKGSRRWAHALGNALWHTDSSFNQHRSKYSLLLAHKIPEGGQANTEFADTRQAWKDLSDTRKEELRGMIVEHELCSTNNRNTIPDSQEIIWDLIHHCSQGKVHFLSHRFSKRITNSLYPYDENMGVRDVRRATVFDDGDEAFGTPIKK
ncbi:uncharacterized protein TRUGW13939_00022, partial [Talaromyces rugulosus]